MSGITGLVVSYAGMLAIGIAYRLCLMYENKRRDQKYGVLTEDAKEEAILKGFQDYTDKQNTGFRYEL